MSRLSPYNSRFVSLHGLLGKYAVKERDSEGIALSLDDWFEKAAGLPTSVLAIPSDTRLELSSIGG
jgi:hypothetical protein